MTLSVIIPALNAAGDIVQTIASVAGASEVIVADGGSDDATCDVAGRAGAKIIKCERGRGVQLVAGAREATGHWLLFLHADTCLGAGWLAETKMFMADPLNAERAGVFRFSLDDESAQARRLEKIVTWRSRVLGLPYGDQGLLISRAYYNRIGGFREMPIMEDVDLVRRIGRDRIIQFESWARTSAARWRHDGWRARSLRNVACLTLYFLGVPVKVIQRIYG